MMPLSPIGYPVGLVHFLGVAAVAGWVRGHSAGGYRRRGSVEPGQRGQLQGIETGELRGGGHR